MTNVYDDIKAERERQDKLWGGAAHDDDHTDTDWASFIGKRSDELLMRSQTDSRTRELFLHIAALAVAAIESMDRTKEQR